MNFSKSKLFIVIGILILGIGGYYWQTNYNTSTDEEKQQELIVMDVTRGDITNEVSASGVIETANYLSITTSVNGIVKEVFVNEGDTVLKGQKIMEVTLNSDGEESLSSTWASYLSAKNSLESAKTNLIKLESAKIRAEEAFQDEKEINSYQTHDERTAFTLAENDYENATADYNNQLNDISQKEAALSKSWLSYQAQSPTIVAPSNGTIANIVVVEGMDISNSLSEKTSSSVASIKNEGTPIASVDVNELDINKVVVGQETRLTLTSNTSKIFKGKVVGIDKIGQNSSGVTTYTVIVKFDEVADEALPGMGVDVEIIVEEKNDVVSVPSSAITNRKGQSYVTSENGTEIVVETGLSDGKNTEIISGVEEGDKIKVKSLPISGFSETSEQNNNENRAPGLVPGTGGGRGFRD